MHKLIVILTTAFFAFILWVIYLADTNADAIFFDFVRSFPYGDKLGHFCLFGMLTFGAVIGCKFRSFRLGVLRIYYGVALVVFFVISEELTQLFIPSRTFDLVDLLADAAGIITAAFVAYCVNKRFRL